jgi:hypothetical protein
MSHEPTDTEVAQLVRDVENFVSDVATADDCWHLRDLLRRAVYEARGLPVPKLPSLWDTKPGLVVEP